MINPPGLGPGDREFKSHRLDHFLLKWSDLGIVVTYPELPTPKGMGLRPLVSLGHYFVPVVKLEITTPPKVLVQIRILSGMPFVERRAYYSGVTVQGDALERDQRERLLPIL